MTRAGSCTLFIARNAAISQYFAAVIDIPAIYRKCKSDVYVGMPNLCVFSENQRFRELHRKTRKIVVSNFSAALHYYLQFYSAIIYMRSSASFSKTFFANCCYFCNITIDTVLKISVQLVCIGFLLF